MTSLSFGWAQRVLGGVEADAVRGRGGSVDEEDVHDRVRALRSSACFCSSRMEQDRSAQ